MTYLCDCTKVPAQIIRDMHFLEFETIDSLQYCPSGEVQFMDLQLSLPESQLVHASFRNVARYTIRAGRFPRVHPHEHPPTLASVTEITTSSRAEETQELHNVPPFEASIGSIELLWE